MENQNSMDPRGAMHGEAAANEISVSKRPLISASFGLAVLCFFFVFCDLKCGEQKIASVTGIQFVTGAELSGMDIDGPRRGGGDKLPPNIWAIIAFGTGLIGLGSFLFNKKVEAELGIAMGVFGAASLILLQMQVANEFTRGSNEGLIVEFQMGYWLSLLALVVAAVISGTMVSQTAKASVPPPPVPPPPPERPPRAEETTQQAVEVIYAKGEPEPPASADAAEKAAPAPEAQDAPPKGRKLNNILLLVASAGLVLLAVGYFGVVRPYMQSEREAEGLLLTGKTHVAGGTNPAAINQPNHARVKKRIIRQMVKDGALQQDCIDELDNMEDAVDIQRIVLSSSGKQYLMSGSGCGFGARSAMYWIYEVKLNRIKLLADLGPADDVVIIPKANGYSDIEIMGLLGAGTEQAFCRYRFNGREYVQQGECVFRRY